MAARTSLIDRAGGKAHHRPQDLRASRLLRIGWQVIIDRPSRTAKDRRFDATSRQGGNAMLSSQEKEPPPQTSAQSPEHAFRIETSFRISILGVAIAACVVILLLLAVAMYAGFNAMLRPLVTLLGIAAAFASLLSRGHIRVGWRRSADSLDDIRAMLPEGAKKVYDLNDLPPDLANNPEVRRLFERAGARGA